jgi:cutinase
MATTCPDTKIVLGGYSQGAAVVDIITVADQPTLGFSQPMSANVADHVAAVAVFGNPSIRLLGGPLNALSPLVRLQDARPVQRRRLRVLERR